MKTGARIAFVAVVVTVTVSSFSAPISASGTLTKSSAQLTFSLPDDAIGDMHLSIDESSRRAFHLIKVSGGTLIRVYDLDRLNLLKETRLAREIVSDLAVVDKRGGRLIAPFVETDPNTRIPSFKGAVVLSVATLNATIWTAQIGAPPSGMSAMPQLVDTFYYEAPRPEDDKLLFYYQDEAVTAAFAPRFVSNTVFIAQWSAATGAHEWAFRIAACRGQLPGGNPRHEMFRDAKYAYVGCVTSDNTGLATRIPLSASSPPASEETYPGPPLTNLIVADPGGKRLGFVIEKDARQSLFVFDGGRTSYVGAMSVTNDPTAGVTSAIDPTTGRYVAITADNGIVLGDIRRTPTQQALVFPSFKQTGGGVLAIEPAVPGHPRRYFFRNGADPFFQIFRDGIPVAADPKLSDLDRFTAGIREQEGVTDSSFDAEAHGYGVRSLLVGGIEGIASGEGRRQFRRAGSPCTVYDREVIAGFVAETKLSKGEAAASSIAGEADPGTKTDVAKPAARCWINPDPFDTGLGLQGIGVTWPQWGEDLDSEGRADAAAGRTWPFRRLECTGKATQEAEDDPTGTGYSGGYLATVSCADEAGRVSALARARGEDFGAKFGLGAEPAVRVAEAVATSTIERMPQGGVVARTEAWSRGIEILGIGHIELVRTIAVSQAAGRKGTAHGAFHREICGITLPGYEQTGCEDHETAVARLNQALGARGRAFIRSPDQALMKGSPGGYLASVQKDRFEELSDRALNNDQSTQVSGLEILLINDNIEFGRARQVFQFAGVDAQTTYGIFLLPTFVEFPPPPVLLPPLPPLPPRFVDVPPPPGPPAPKPVVETYLERVRDGVAIALRDPLEAVLAALTWLALSLPLFMAYRRRSMGRILRRHR